MLLLGRKGLIITKFSYGCKSRWKNHRQWNRKKQKKEAEQMAAKEALFLLGGFPNE